MRKTVALFVLINFIASCIMPPQGFAQALSAVGLMSAPGTPVALTPAFTPAHLKGMVINANDPFSFDFLVHQGDAALANDAKQLEYSKLIKYFLAALAVPDTDQWVNLSPYEQDRMIPGDFGKTEMGRDVLAQDYLLKQITSSLTDPNTDLGKKFWDEVYAQAYEKFGTTNIPNDTFNKVWITPGKAVMYEKGDTVYVLEHGLKVMMEKDYVAANQRAERVSGEVSQQSDLTQDIMREVIIPAIEKEVNEGKSFAPLRQIYSGMLLATWYKQALKDSILGRVYADQSKVQGVDQDPKNNEQIYARYVEAFKTGVFNMIREDIDRYTHETIARKYFSGGFSRDNAEIERKSNDPALEAGIIRDAADVERVATKMITPAEMEERSRARSRLPAVAPSSVEVPVLSGVVRLIRSLKVLSIPSKPYSGRTFLEILRDRNFNHGFAVMTPKVSFPVVEEVSADVYKEVVSGPGYAARDFLDELRPTLREIRDGVDLDEPSIKRQVDDVKEILDALKQAQIGQFGDDSRSDGRILALVTDIARHLRTVELEKKGQAQSSLFVEMTRTAAADLLELNFQDQAGRMRERMLGMLRDTRRSGTALDMKMLQTQMASMKEDATTLRKDFPEFVFGDVAGQPGERLWDVVHDLWIAVAYRSSEQGVSASLEVSMDQARKELESLDFDAAMFTPKQVMDQVIRVLEQLEKDKDFLDGADALPRIHELIDKVVPKKLREPVAYLFDVALSWDIGNGEGLNKDTIRQAIEVLRAGAMDAAESSGERRGKALTTQELEALFSARSGLTKKTPSSVRLPFGDLIGALVNVKRVLSEPARVSDDRSSFLAALRSWNDGQAPVSQEKSVVKISKRQAAANVRDRIVALLEGLQRSQDFPSFQMVNNVLRQAWNEEFPEDVPSIEDIGQLFRKALAPVSYGRADANEIFPKGRIPEVVANLKALDLALIQEDPAVMPVAADNISPLELRRGAEGFREYWILILQDLLRNEDFIDVQKVRSADAALDAWLKAWGDHFMSNEAASKEIVRRLKEMFKHKVEIISLEKSGEQNLITRQSVMQMIADLQGITFDAAEKTPQEMARIRKELVEREKQKLFGDPRKASKKEQSQELALPVEADNGRWMDHIDYTDGGKPFTWKFPPDGFEKFILFMKELKRSAAKPVEYPTIQEDPEFPAFRQGATRIREDLLKALTVLEITDEPGYVKGTPALELAVTFARRDMERLARQNRKFVLGVESDQSGRKLLRTIREGFDAIFDHDLSRQRKVAAVKTMQEALGQWDVDAAEEVSEGADTGLLAFRREVVRAHDNLLKSIMGLRITDEADYKKAEPALVKALEKAANLLDRLKQKHGGFFQETGGYQPVQQLFRIVRGGLVMVSEPGITDEHKKIFLDLMVIQKLEEWSTDAAEKGPTEKPAAYTKNGEARPWEFTPGIWERIVAIIKDAMRDPFADPVSGNDPELSKFIKVVDQIQADLLLALADLGIKNAAEYKESESKVQWAFAEAMKKMERAAREYRRFVFGAGEREPGGQLFDIIYDGRKIVEAKDLSYGETITAMRRIEARLQAWPEDPLDISIDKAESLTKTASQIRDQILAPLNRLANIKETSNDLKYVLTAKDVWDMFLKTAKQPLDPKSPAGKFSSILEDVCSKDLVPMQAGNMTAVTRWKIGTAVKKLRALNFDAAEAPVLQSDLDQFIKALNRPGALDEVIIHMPESEGDFWQAGVEDFRMNGVSYRMLVFYRPEQQKTQRPEDASVLYVKLSSEGRPMRWIKIYRVDQKERMGLPLSTGKPKEIDVIIKKLGISRMMQSQGDPAQKGAQWLNLTKFINALDDADLDDLEVRQLAGDGPVWEAAATGFQMDGISYELIVHYKPGDGKVSRQPQGQSYLFVKLSQQGVRKKFGKFYYTDYMGRFNQPAEPGRPQEIDHIIQKLGIDARIKSAKDAAEIVVTDLMAALKNITGPVSVGLSTVNDDFMGVPKSEGGKIELNGVVHTMTVYDNGDFLNIRLKAANGLEKMLVLYTSRNSDEIAKIRHVVRMDKYKKPIFGHPASIQYVPVREDAITAAPDQRIDLDQFILGLRSMADRTPVEPSEMLWRSKQAAGTAFVNGVRSRVIVHDDEDQLNIEIKVGDELQQRIILRPAQHAAQMQQVREILGLDKVTAQDLFKMRMGRADAAEASAISLDDLMKMLEDMQRSGDVRFREHWIRDCMTADGDAFWNGTSYRVVVNDYGTALDILVVSRKDDVKTQIMLSEAEYSGIIGKIRELFGLPVKEEKDAAMKGGIDFGLSNLDMQIKRDGDGVPLPVSQQDLESIRIDGLVPVILNIQPAANIPLFSDAGGAATPAA